MGMTIKKAMPKIQFVRNALNDDMEIAKAYDLAIETMRKYQKLNQEPILNKIRAEIKALSNANPSCWHSGDMVDRDDVLEILDKYKAEGNKEV